MSWGHFIKSRAEHVMNLFVLCWAGAAKGARCWTPASGPAGGAALACSLLHISLSSCEVPAIITPSLTKGLRFKCWHNWKLVYIKGERELVVKGTGQSLLEYLRLSIRLVSKQHAPVLTFINDTHCWWLILNYCHIWSPVSISGFPSTRQSGIYWRRCSHACAWAPDGVIAYGWPREWGTGKWVTSEFPLIHKWKLFYFYGKSGQATEQFAQRSCRLFTLQNIQNSAAFLRNLQSWVLCEPWGWD